MATTLEIIAEIRSKVRELASGEASDFDDLPSHDYLKASDECLDLSQYLDNISESFKMASSEELTCLLAEVCELMSDPQKGASEPTKVD